jgi:putative tricarboxylic transport membrane protein
MRAPVVGAVAVVLAAAAIALEATTFDVMFPTDPLGPKAFPMLAAFLLAIGGGALLRDGLKGGAAGAAAGGRAGVAAGLPLGDGTAPPPPAAPVTAVTAARTRILLATLSFVAYAFLLAPLGFVFATVLEFALLARLFGGTLVRGAAVGLAFAVLLYVLFVYGLGLLLPLGVFER